MWKIFSKIWNWFKFLIVVVAITCVKCKRPQMRAGQDFLLSLVDQKHFNLKFFFLNNHSTPLLAPYLNWIFFCYKNETNQNLQKLQFFFLLAFYQEGGGGHFLYFCRVFFVSNFHHSIKMKPKKKNYYFI